MGDQARFREDLYRGSASYYDRYRLPYPEAMIADLARRAGLSGRGRLLDLACGTGQLAFPLCRWFREVRAVDSEPDMAEVVRAKAAAMGAAGVRAVVSKAETFQAEPGYFELAVIGNAFHRLDRDLAASRIFGWLQPGGHLALCWSASPWAGPEAWQRALAATLDRWKTALGAGSRVPAGWDLDRQHRPDPQVLSGAGFTPAGRREFAVGHRWSLPELAGHIRSTSFLAASVLGDQAAAFDADLAAALGPHSDGGTFAETVEFAYELVRKPVFLPIAAIRLPTADSWHNDRNGQKTRAPSKYELEGALAWLVPPGRPVRPARRHSPPAGARYPREEPVSQLLPAFRGLSRAVPVSNGESISTAFLPVAQESRPIFWQFISNILPSTRYPQDIRGYPHAMVVIHRLMHSLPTSYPAYPGMHK